MRNKLYQQILDETTEETKIFVRKYGKIVRELSKFAGDASSLLQIARCPNCDGSGAMPHEIRSNGIVDIDWEQCQWCAERDLLLGTPDDVLDHGIDDEDLPF